jgi:FkbM family methyltransferase
MKKLIKTLYDTIPFKKYLFLGLKIFWTPPEKIYKHLHFKGTINIEVDTEHAFKMYHHGYLIENEIFWKGLTGSWEKISLGIWIKLSRTSSVILDIGANTGIYAMVAKTVNKQAKVYAFEPVQRVFKKLEKNIALNNYDILAFEKAVSNNTGTAIIYDTDAKHTFSVTVNKNMSDDLTQSFIETVIEIITLDSFIKENNIEKIDLIKIDVETHEPEVLEGFRENIQKFKPTLLIEILNNDIANKIQSLVAGMDYLYFNIDELGGVRQVDRLTKSDYYNYLICSKKVAEELILL